MLRWALRWLVRLLFGFRAYNEEVLRTPGPVLLIPNHVSWIDWLFLYVCVDYDWKCVVSSVSAQTSWVHRKIMLNRRTFPIDTTSPYAVKRMAEYLEGKGRLALFAEGRLSRTGTMMKLFEGTGFLLHKTGAKVITCYLRGAHRLPFSPNANKKRWFPRITAHFGEVLVPPHLDHMSTAEARTRLTTWLRDKLIEQQFDVEMEFGPNNLLDGVAERARQFPKKVVLEDINRQQLNYRRLLVGTRLLAEKWRDLTGGERIGVLLPNVNAMPVVTLSLWAAGRIPAILNYSTGMPIMLACAELAGLKQIITSRTFLARAKINAAPLTEAGIELIYVEDVRKTISGGQRLRTLLAEIMLNPRFRASPSPESTAVVLFTSGSEGVPKGVELTHRNLLANIRQMLAMIDLVDTDRFFNALPLFHSFGLSVGTFLPLVRGLFVFLYPSPLHYRVVPTAFYNLDCTVMFGTNTFLNGYARKAHPYDFRALRYLFAGAEKLQESTANTWMRRFGVRVIEGYGATECSPCLSANTPIAPKHGSAGRFLPRIEYRVEPAEGVHEGGRLFVRGPNIMRGYLNADANQKFLKLGGWYDTGDIVRVDDEGFLFILGRLKRFAKVSGEMVSLTAVEEALASAFPEHGLRFQIAVVTRPDADKGEALIAVTNEQKLKLEDIRAIVRQKGLPGIATPRELKFVKEIPKLGTGKVNHRELERVIREMETPKTEHPVSVPAASV
jgi:acyl-[acyl-carrier-protein]-phospholipid O-acyltransferase / long-chain-fatty-acid--[acyl-carrier-protein] ligase